MPNDDIFQELRVPSVRIAPDSAQVLQDLGPLADMAGTWQGHGFNLVARPDFEGNANLFLELNLTRERLKFDPISTSIPNRGFGQNDAELFGLTYLQQISDATTGGALHIEPGIWVSMPLTTDPNLPPSVFRMGSIPHGNTLLAEGSATPFEGPPTLSPNNTATGANPAFSLFPSFNSTPFVAAPPPAPPGPIFAGGTSEAGSAPPNTNGGFSQYTLTNPASAANPRTPFGNTPPELPPEITQRLVNDPITLLQDDILKQVADGHTFKGTALNIATATPILFGTEANAAAPTTSVAVPSAGGDIGNIPFLQKNAVTALTYATFWITEVSHPQRRSFMQLQYAQMVFLNFPALLVPNSPVFVWPHVSVATLRQTFG